MSTGVWLQGAGTLWANCGINQFHLPQEQEAQVLAGSIVLEYPDLESVAARLDAAPSALAGSKFAWSRQKSGALEVTCPWGNRVQLRQGSMADPRGKQPGPASEPMGMPELQIHVPAGRCPHAWPLRVRTRASDMRAGSGLRGSRRRAARGAL